MKQCREYRDKKCRREECDRVFTPIHSTNNYCCEFCFKENRRKLARIRERELRVESKRYAEK